MFHKRSEAERKNPRVKHPHVDVGMGILRFYLVMTLEVFGTQYMLTEKAAAFLPGQNLQHSPGTVN